MKILFISSMALFKNTRFGGSKRLYYFAREMERNTRLHLLCLDGSRELMHQSSPTEFRNRLFLPMVPSKSFWRRIFFLPDAEETIALHQASIKAFLGNEHFDATLLAFPFSLCFLDHEWKRQMGKIIYLEDDLLLEYYRRDLSRKMLGIKKLVKFFRYQQALLFFRQRMKQVETFVCISEQEEKIVRLQFPDLPTRIFKYGIPLENYPLLEEPREKNVLGFIGNYQHLPNLDAVDWLVRELFPFLLQNEPAARLMLAGKNFPADLKKFCGPSFRIQVLDTVDNVEDFYRDIGIFVNPLREGRGLRTKLVEAAAFGRPILSTELGAEGLNEFQMGLFASKEQFLSAFRTLVKNPEYSDVSRHNRNEVEAGFSLSKLGGDLTRLLAGSET